MKNFRKTLLFMAIVAVTLCGCNRGVEASRTDQIARQRPEHWHTDVLEPAEAKVETVYGYKNLGSHILYVTKPVLTPEFQDILDDYYMDVVEVYFERNEDGGLPLCSAEPNASAVYYFYSKEAGELTVDWQSPGGENILLAGVTLKSPDYQLKLITTSQPDNELAVNRLVFSDFTGFTTEFAGVKESYFGLDYLQLSQQALEGIGGGRQQEL